MKPYAMSIADAAAYVGVSTSTIQRAKDGGGLPAEKAGAKVIIRTADLEAWVDAGCPRYRKAA